jgi:peptidoglycan/LPS O-acetylase OafA/YrhL
MSASASHRSASASLALSNLRAVLILIVLVFHGVLPDLGSLPAGAHAFDDPERRWQAFPIVDSQRFFGFDLFCAWQYLSMMALMFFLSGLFVAPSLARKGAREFLTGRLLRIGVPLVPAVAILTPLAYYASYRATAADPSFAAFWQEWTALPFWSPGPQWFLILLLAFSVLAAALHVLAPRLRDRMFAAAARAAERPLRFFAGLAAVSALAYVPLALAFSPWSWTNFGPVAFETTRIAHYAVYVLAGYALGAAGLGRGMLDCDGPLARNWAKWLSAAALGFGLWAGSSTLTLGAWNEVPLAARFLAAVALVLGCAAGCMFALALALRFGRKRRAVFDSLSANAYGIYLLHYVPAVWLQFALLDAPLPAIAKGAIVFAVTLLVTWPLAAAIGTISLRSLLPGMKRVRSA